MEQSLYPVTGADVLDGDVFLGGAVEGQDLGIPAETDNVPDTRKGAVDEGARRHVVETERIGSLRQLGQGQIGKRYIV